MRIFKEEQRFTQTWLLVIISFSTLIPLAIIIKEFSEKQEGMSQSELIISILGVLLAAGLIFIFKLETRIDENGIHYKFFPFHLKMKTIKWENIKKAYVRNYDPIGEYGGWGLKGGAFWNKSKGRAINVSGTVGIQLELKNGKKILIGTHKEQDAKQVLVSYANKTQ
tara:strand:- start:1407 stop:1907 length:501 start_codon:yes stop_codon:yes gene_type:complete